MITGKFESNEEILELLKKNDILIYGAGYIAKLFIKILKDYDLVRNVRSFVVTQIEKEEWENIPIRSIDEIKKNDSEIICIATHESIKKEIEDELVRRHFNNYIWIFPYMKRLMYHSEIDRGVEVPVGKILKANLGDYRIAVRYYTLEHMKDIEPNQVYLKVFSTFSNGQTSRKRFEAFKDLSANWNENGYNAATPVLLDKEFKILDGAHRFSLAVYYEMDTLVCDVCTESVDLSKYEEEAVFMTENTLIDAGLTEEEKNEVLKIQNMLKEKCRRS